MSRALLSLASTLLAVLLLEGAMRVTRLDERLLRRGLYYQQAELPVHQCSADPFLHYELKPGASFRGSRPDGQSYEVSIDANGARCPAHVRRKAASTFRMLCFGGSTMYGAGVNDDQTIPAALEARLNRLPRPTPASALRYEVWNFGTSAYTLGQAAHLARSRLSTLDPDGIVIQLHNVGRRPYLPAPLCDAVDFGDRDFFLEQFPVPGWVDAQLHLTLLAQSAVYRALIAQSVRAGDGAPCEYCDRLSQSEARTLVQEAGARHVAVLFMAIPADRGVIRPDGVYAGLPAAQLVDLYRPGREPGFYEVHPSAATLDEYASMLLDAMGEHGLFATDGRP